MNFILLGTGSGMPDPIHRLSSLFVEQEGNNLLFDCGEGASWQLLKHGLAGEKLDAICVSHYHPDHFSGLFMVLQMLHLQNRRKALKLFLPERHDMLLDMLRGAYTFPEKLSFELQAIDNDDIKQHFPAVSSAPNDHLLGYQRFIQDHGLPNQMASHSFRISSPAGDLAYTSDIATTDSVMELLRGCHTVVVDALHPAPEQIIKLRDEGIGRILLTHGLSPSLKQRLELEPQSMIETAREDCLYEI